MTVDGATLPGELSVPRGADALVVVATGGCGAGHTERENDIADLLYARGIGTFLVDLVGTGERPSRSRRLNSGLFAHRLDGVVTWVDGCESTASLDLGFLGVDTGAAAVLQVFSSGGVDPSAVAVLNGRVDLVEGPLSALDCPGLFVVESGYEHLHESNRDAAGRVGTDGSPSLLFTDSDSNVVPITAGWFQSHMPTGRVQPRASRWRRALEPVGQ